MIKNSLPIGVFDSGMGGLTVLKALKVAMPQESFIYLGDTARLPYGTKSHETVSRYACQMVNLLLAREIKCLVVACNTATMAALPLLRQTLNIPVIGVIEPSAKAAVNECMGGEILVLATEATIRSNIYQRMIQRLSPRQRVKNLSCGLFVSLVEEGCINNQVTKAAIEHYLGDNWSLNIDTLILGCTHFPLLTPAIRQFVGDDIKIINSAYATADTVKQHLKQALLLSDENAYGFIRYLVTDLPERFCRIGSLFMGETIAMTDVELLDPGELQLKLS